MAATRQAVRWGIMGTARIAAKVGAAIHKAAGAELVAVASRSQDRANQWAAEHQVPRRYGDYQALLDDADLDAVYIPLPPSLHHQWTIRAAEAGKHILCEKPLACSTSDAVEMWAASQEHGRQLMDGVMWVHHPRARDMLQVVRDGTLGRLRRMTSAFSFNWEVIPEGDLRLQRDLGGGCLLDLGWYCVRAALWAYCALPQRVYGTARYYQDVDRNFSGLMWFDGERMASFDSGFDTQMRKWLEVAGTKASLVCDDFTKPWDEDKPRFWVHDAAGKLSETVSQAPIQEVCMIEDFSRQVQSGTLNESWARDAIETQRVCEALDRSARSGVVVEMDQ